MADKKERKELKLRMDMEEYYDLYEKSHDKGMTMNDYIRECLRNHTSVTISLDDKNIEQVSNDFSETSRLIAGIVPVILKSEVVTKKDIEIICSLLIQMDEKVCELYRVSFNDRKRLYEEAKKRLSQSTDRRKRTNKVR